MVVLFHVATRYPDPTLDVVARWFDRYGFLGVDIFFPLSGFLISRFLLEGGWPGFTQVFFLRRFFRIVPLYAAAVLTYVAAVLVTGLEAETLHRVWINATFLTGWFIFLDARETVPYTITWSLSVEEFAYILLGLFAALSVRRLVHFLVVLSVLPLLLRFWLNVEGATDIYFFPPARLDSIALGGLTAWALARHPRLVLPVLVAATLVVFAATQIGGDLPRETLLGAVGPTLLYSWIALATCAAIVLAETLFAGRGGRPAWAIAQIGFYSYFIYLFHFFVIDGLAIGLRILGLGLPPFWAMSVLTMAVTTAAAIVSFHLFEGPLMRFGRRLEPAFTRPAPPGAPGNGRIRS